ncbi:MAG TPA: EF-Tu/IF-2/RF-3 family GTPase, partial [Prolixibacteraceae bacterium]|nr:EF-Tu/IF-2/RF-3 family GTPase [Prolixibacteraceae bacterium]
EEVQEMVFDLMFNLDADENQLDFPTIFGSAKDGWMSENWNEKNNNIIPLLDSVIKHIPEPKVENGSTQMLITSIDFSPYVGRIAVGRLHRGTLTEGQQVSLCHRDGSIKRTKIKELNVFTGLGRTKVSKVEAGDICALVGIEGFEIGDTIAEIENPEPLPPIAIDEPTMSMLFTINNSPFFGKDGKFVTSRHIFDRLKKELERNLALRVEETNSADSWNVFGRGVLHLSVLIETMRREGFELQVGQPQVIIKDVDGVKSEPVEELTIDVLEDYSGKVIELVTRRKGELLTMERKGERTVLEFNIPSRGIIGLRNNVLTATAGEAIISHRFIEFQPYKGEIEKRNNGSLVCLDTGTAIAYALDKLQDRGKFFVKPGEEVYEGEVIGESTREDDLTINITKTKKLTNMRASGSDDKSKLAPPVLFSLEEALEYIQSDEYVEITPKNIRLRKIFLKEHERKKLNK